MKDPFVYGTFNSVQRTVAQNTFNRLKHLIQWCPDGDDKIMDIGCGTGDVTYDFMLPILPENFKLLNGIDKCADMIKYANEKFNHPKIEFNVMDIVTPPSTESGKYNHIFSNCCLQWIPDQRMVMQNIFNLLQSNGDCLMVILAKNPIQQQYNGLKNHPKFAEFCQDCDTFVSPYFFNSDPVQDAKNLMDSIGFVDCHVELLKQDTVFELNYLKNFCCGVDPFVHRMPADIQKDLLEYYMQKITEQFIPLQNPDTKEYYICVEIYFVVVYGRKSK